MCNLNTFKSLCVHVTPQRTSSYRYIQIYILICNYYAASLLFRIIARPRKSACLIGSGILNKLCFTQKTNASSSDTLCPIDIYSGVFEPFMSLDLRFIEFPTPPCPTNAMPQVIPLDPFSKSANGKGFVVPTILHGSLPLALTKLLSRKSSLFMAITLR
mmetsp:Transcript_934/g.1218  ORF Transcript_934/g.1218 Transcript_934/m.1218 type:complete len:159 (+) Transcript_934:81-557(+)